MGVTRMTHNDIFGLIRPEIDVHTLGVSTVGRLLEECGYKVIVGDALVAKAVAQISHIDNISLLKKWILDNRITRIGFSYRLDPRSAQLNFGKVYNLIKDNKLMKEDGGPIIQLYFAGLPDACKRVAIEYNNQIPVFIGDETQVETLTKIGVPIYNIPGSVTQNSKYDDERLVFAKELIHKGEYHFQLPVDRSGYKSFGTKNDTIMDRIDYSRSRDLLPITRVHVGPYNPNYEEAKKEFKSWLKILSETKFLDVVSIGSSQLSQSDFGNDWGDRPNGGGVPINSEKDLYEIWESSRPMLVRTYSSTRNVPDMVPVYEKTINIAWHALSLWWFNQIDGRGPNTVKENLRQHLLALDEIAKTNKPFEPNIPHHFSFRGGDDYTYVLSSYLAAITAKKRGVRYLILQTMLNTPKYTWGIQDVAKARALLKLVRELEDKNFKVYHQPRAGLDYFSPDLEKAKIQLASVTAMMDDIEPLNSDGPDIIHVVSYSEAVHLANPKIINESVQITHKAIADYRRAKKKGFISEIINGSEFDERTRDLYWEVKNTVEILEKNIPDLYSPDGLYRVFKEGVFAVPYLWEGKEEFKEAIKWRTQLIQGSVQVVDDLGQVLKPSQRLKSIF